jgi:acetyltransferase-like isoleucine patch superfamily enzyme
MRTTAGMRIGWMVATLFTVEVIVCGLAALPAVLLWQTIVPAASPTLRLAAMAGVAVPAYVTFALCLMPVSAGITRALGWTSRPDLRLRLADCEWPLLDWARAAASGHVVRLFAGPLFKGTPIWTWYLRLSGARVGRRCYVNTLAISDYSLLEFGDDVLIGDGAHISGHTVERGCLRTGRVRIGSQVTVGIGAIIGIGASIGRGTQLGALSLVPKHVTLAADTVYVGVPARRLRRSTPARPAIAARRTPRSFATRIATTTGGHHESQ